MTDWAESPEDKVEVSEDDQPSKLGPTGEHPDGKISEDDEGQIQLAVGVTKTGDVFMDFGTKVKWLAFDPGEAIDVAKMIAFNAQKAARVREILEKQKEGAKLVGANGKPLQT
jgi:hypothetical protein